MLIVKGNAGSYVNVPSNACGIIQRESQNSSPIKGKRCRNKSFYIGGIITSVKHRDELPHQRKVRYQVIPRMNYQFRGDLGK